MPKHISETLLSACGCHTALAVQANICQLLCRQKMEFPVRFKGYGLRDTVPNDEAVFHC